MEKFTLDWAASLFKGEDLMLLHASTSCFALILVTLKENKYRMHTACFLLVSPCMHCGGCMLWRVSAPSGGVYPSMHCEQNDRQV